MKLPFWKGSFYPIWRRKMVNFEVLFLVLWMEIAWAIRMKLYLAYLAIPILFYLIHLAMQSIRDMPYPSYFLPNAIALSFLFTSFLVAFGFVQKGRSFWNLSRLSGSPPLYIFLGELSFSSFVAILQTILFFLLIRLFSGIGSFGNFLSFLLVSLIFSSLPTLLFLLLSLTLKFKPLHFLYIACVFLLLSLPFSNVFFPIQSLPPIISFIALLNPLTYGVEGFTWALGGRSSLAFFSPWVFFSLYLLLFALLLYLLGIKSKQ